MDKQRVNLRSWQVQLGFTQAWRVDGPQSTVFLARQAPISPDGKIVGEGRAEFIEGSQAASTAIGVTSLALPAMMNAHRTPPSRRSGSRDTLGRGRAR